MHHLFATILLGLASITLFGCIEKSHDYHTQTLPNNTFPKHSITSTLDTKFLQIVSQVPGFGGLYVDPDTIYVYLKDLGNAPIARRILAPMTEKMSKSRRATKSTRNFVFLKGQFDFSELHATFSSLSKVLTVSNVAFLDIDERKNKIIIGITAPSARVPVEAMISSRNLNRAMMEFELTRPIKQVANLQDERRPPEGGLQIKNNAGMTCSLGFNGHQNWRDAPYGFITASHCTRTQGGEENTDFYQNGNSWFSMDYVGREASDPQYKDWLDGCPPGRVCRYSDSAWIRYDPSRTSGFYGKIAKPKSYCYSPEVYCSLELDNADPRFSLSGSRPYREAVAGEDVEKIGRTTGWTFGPVARTCFNGNPDETNITFLCQYSFNAGVDSGDSGSPVFIWSEGIGILWGSIGNSEVIYSGLNQVAYELGDFNID